MNVAVLIFLAFLAWVLPNSTLAGSEPPVVLIFGAGDYPGNSIDLPNAVSDARLVAGAFNKIHAEVALFENPNRQQVFREIDGLSNTLEKDRTVVFYFSGHGVQISGENFLIPSDLRPRSLDDISKNAIPVSDVIAKLASVGAGNIIVILDACRNNPFGEAAKGLAIVRTATPDVLIAFATSPGEVAYDGPAGQNSIYSASLAEGVVRAGLSVEELFKRTRSRVIGLTGYRQVPWESSSLREDVYFTDPGTAAASGVTQCDVLAGHPSDPERVTAGVAYRLLRPTPAIAACRSALEDDPDNPRLLTELARALEKAGKYDEAVDLNQRALDKGYLGAYHNLGNLYRKGAGVPRDQKKALELFLHAAELGHPEDAYNVGNMYFRGIKDMDKDYAKALFWFDRSAAQDYPSAFDRLGLIYRNGYGVDKSIEHANAEFARGAALGDPSATVNYANSFRRGEGVAKDYKRALELYTQAAQLRQRSAYVNLGFMYKKGQGTDPNPNEAAVWFGIAARAGHEESLKEYKALMKELSELDRETVDQRIEDWYRFEFG